MNIPTTKPELVSIVCDRCKKEKDTMNDIMDIQEWLHINFVGGYASIFGDLDEYECDLCQQCTKEILGKYLRFVKVHDLLG